MSMYRKEWDCCGSITETDAWEPESCPFCADATPPSPSIAASDALRDIASNGGSPGATARAALQVIASLGPASKLAPSTAEDEMPALPAACPMVLPSGWIRYTADQMRTYARDALSNRASGTKELLAALKKAKRYVGMVRSSDIAGDDQIFGVMQEIDEVIAKATPGMSSIRAALSANAADREENGWISVDDERKPDERTSVLLYVRTLTRGEDDDGRPYETEGEQVEMGEYRHNNGSPYFSCYVSPMSDNDWVTHWMPLPVGPNGGLETDKEKN